MIGAMIVDVTSVEGRMVSIHEVGAGPRLICVPGGPGFHGEFYGDLGGLADSRTLVSFDWRGAGHSDPPSDERHAVEDYLHDFEALSRQRGWEHEDVYGNSFGAMVAASYADRHPERVRRLVLDGLPDVLDDGRAPKGGLEDYFADWSPENEAWINSQVVRLNWAASEWFVAHEWTTYDIRPVVRRIAVPTLVVSGDADWAVGPDRAREMAASMPDARAAVIADAGHFAWVEQPAAYREAVLAFLEG
jgi:proline iminopeptidase